MIRCRDRLVARAVLPPPPARPALGAGASIGPIRRVVLPGIVCVSLGAGITAAVMHEIAETPPQEQRATVRVVDAEVPEPAALGLLGVGVVAIAVMRRRRN